MELNKAQLIVKNLNFRHALDEPLLEEVSLQLKLPGFHAVCGRSGVGKSTLAKILSGLQCGWKAAELLLPGKILYCYGKERLPPWQSVRSHLQDVTPSLRKPMLRQFIESFKLGDDILDRRPDQVSVGQIGRLNVLRYLVQDFDLLILDEALIGVDEPTRLEILGRIKALLPQRSFLYISHHVLDVANFANSILVLRPSSSGIDLKFLTGLDRKVRDTNDQNLANKINEILDLI